MRVQIILESGDGMALLIQFVRTSCIFNTNREHKKKKKNRSIQQNVRVQSNIKCHVYDDFKTLMRST